MARAGMLRYDVSYLISASLLVAGVAAATTGLASDLQDLNEFVYHKYVDYVLAGLGLAHVYLHWGRLVNYARWRLGRSARAQKSKGTMAPGSGRIVGNSSVHPGVSAPLHGLSRRGFVGLVLGGLGGFALGRGFRPQTALPYGGDVGAIYHEWSKPKLLSLLGTVANWGRQPALYKEYAWAERILLPAPDNFRGLSTEEAIQRRRSVRDYSGQPITLAELSRLLYYTDGITAERWGYKLRAAPSAGALYPIEIYPVVHRVEGL